MGRAVYYSIFSGWFVGDGDKVKCFCCGVEINEWTMSDVALVLHAQRFPMCNYVKREKGEEFIRSVRNVSFEGTTGESPPVISGGQDRDRHNSDNTHPWCGQRESLLGLKATDELSGKQMHTGTPLLSDSRLTLEQLRSMRLESRRLDSFSTWSTSANVRKENLAKAGLYYLGIADQVKCAFCNGILQNWEPTDDPMAEHRKFFPNCAFLRDARIAGNVTIEEERVNSQMAAMVRFLRLT